MARLRQPQPVEVVQPRRPNRKSFSFPYFRSAVATWQQLEGQNVRLGPKTMNGDVRFQASR